MAAPTGIIRNAVKEDIPDILAMIRDLANHLDDLEHVKATEELLFKNHGYFYNFGTWTAKPGVYLEDLYVKPECRGKGYGKALLAYLAKEVKRIDGARLDWQVAERNKSGMEFYKGIGAKYLSEWRCMRVDGDGLDTLGEMGPKLEFVE
ncbi:hypothetical protein H072_2523 [Dactylellina haptotyla CBS 200.50]|uniref:N-acetyltransferase domain-containing protein n=1 Tax=Dactylellina haptotyla (strain CBS 200.50) TaxID=1284197 RepID=S8AKM2_DACHA|nr:hypothetical protein H072_2523 [Dactylellina haptotyla CBS 200.50]